MRPVDTGKFRRRGNRQAADTAHPRPIDHQGVQADDGLDLPRSRFLCEARIIT
jgi:hypothetical protein